jgi:isopenicillin N synthase-like dioxygenase
MSLSVLDIGPFMENPSSEAAVAFTEQLREACHEPGFCYLTGHGVDPALEDGLRTVSRQFFDLPEAERRSLAIVNTPAFRGFTILGDERTKGASDWRDQLDLGPEEEAPQIGPGDPPWLRLRGPNQWPPSLPELGPTVLAWMDQVERLGVAATRALAVGLGQPIDRFDDSLLPHVDGHIKIIRYPAQETAADTGQGVGLHHDSGLLTFIFQDDVGGLRVKVGDELVEATPIPGTYIMNLGEMFQSATNGFLKATPHRVDSPPPGVERISIAYFFNPRFESIFEPVVLPVELAARARGAENADTTDRVYSTFGYNNLKIRLRSHPDVAAAHYEGVDL